MFLVGLSVLLAAPAGADAPRPTDYQATVTALMPSSDVVELSVVGGDAFLRVRVDPGHEVVVLGYGGEPYLRVRSDGAVVVNLNSPATYANTDRYADVEVPESADVDAEPAWQRVGNDGIYVWHDHRIHWMSPQPPPGVSRGSEIQAWEVPLLVDGEPVTVTGVLTFEPAPAWWPWPLVVAGIGGVVWLVGRRRYPAVVVALAAGTGCLLAVMVASAEQLSIPTEAGRSPVPVAVPLLGLLCAGPAGVWRDRRVGNIFGLAATAAAVGWAVLRVSVFTKPVLPSDLAPSLDRAGTAGALGLALGAVALSVAVKRPAATRLH